MRFQVEWLETASRRLMESMMDASPDEQQAIVSASVAIDAILEDCPLDVGESRESPTRRVLIQSPLMVNYRVTPRLGLVEIVSATPMLKNQ